MAVDAERTVDGVANALATTGFALNPGVVSEPMIEALSAAVDAALGVEAEAFPVGDDQHGRVLFAPEHGGAFLDLCGRDVVWGPLEAVIGADAILYTLTTSVLLPGGSGPVDRYHVDLAPDRPGGVALAALIVLDPFDATTGATELVPGSHLWGDRVPDDTVPGELLVAGPGDVCYFDPRVWHRSTRNLSAAPRRSVLGLLVRPWMKQRVDVRGMFTDAVLAGLSPAARRRLGLDALPPRGRAEFLARRDQRPWS